MNRLHDEIQFKLRCVEAFYAHNFSIMPHDAHLTAFAAIMRHPDDPRANVIVNVTPVFLEKSANVLQFHKPLVAPKAAFLKHDMHPALRKQFHDILNHEAPHIFFPMIPQEGTLALAVEGETVGDRTRIEEALRIFPPTNEEKPASLPPLFGLNLLITNTPVQRHSTESRTPKEAEHPICLFTSQYPKIKTPVHIMNEQHLAIAFKHIETLCGKVFAIPTKNHEGRLSPPS